MGFGGGLGLHRRRDMEHPLIELEFQKFDETVTSAGVYEPGTFEIPREKEQYAI